MDSEYHATMVGGGGGGGGGGHPYHVHCNGSSYVGVAVIDVQIFPQLS